MRTFAVDLSYEDLKKLLEKLWFPASRISKVSYNTSEIVVSNTYSQFLIDILDNDKIKWRMI